MQLLEAFPEGSADYGESRKMRGARVPAPARLKKRKHQLPALRSPHRARGREADAIELVTYRGLR